MDRKKLLIPIVSLIILIFIMNFLANKFYWYFSIWYFDIIMHFLGGFWLGLVAVYCFSYQSLSGSPVFKILAFILLVGLGWEVFEILINNFAGQIPFNIIDTLLDIVFDISGGLCAILYLWKKLPK